MRMLKQREEEMALMKEEMAWMVEAIARSNSLNSKSGGGRQRRPSHPLPSPNVPQSEPRKSDSVYDRLALFIEDCRVREVVVFRQPASSAESRLGATEHRATLGYETHPLGEEEHNDVATYPHHESTWFISDRLGKAPQGSLGDDRDDRPKARGKGVSVVIQNDDRQGKR
ncbi:hypothetical protein RHSIM_Rhsim06G0113400 [Rhododendron simsii]|uniref:Uncharacterized protein n=1 Tax=Rhododendron simsii TaxID=118357 RepID=A0A834H2A0_RHOSS|nr:hypothetical protein RHSIM_Rhsim06G0113400 [Rhododendron simsii]